MDGSTAPTAPISLDERDVAILEALQQDGQLTVSDLSDRVGLSPSACHRRVKALERAGVIDRYIAVLNPRAMGRKIFPVWLDVNLSSQNAKAQAEFERLGKGAAFAASLGLEVHAGHGLDYDTARQLAGIPAFVEFNIGHFLVGESIFVGLDAAIRRMRAVMDAAA